MEVRFRPFDQSRLTGALLPREEVERFAREYELRLVDVLELSGVYRFAISRDPAAAVASVQRDARVHDAEIAPPTPCPFR